MGLENQRREPTAAKDGRIAAAVAAALAGDPAVGEIHEPDRHAALSVDHERLAASYNAPTSEAPGAAKATPRWLQVAVVAGGAATLLGATAFRAGLLDRLLSSP